MLKFSCEKTLLQQAVSTVSRAVAAKSSIPALEGVLLEGDTQLTLSGYNMQTGIRTAISAVTGAPLEKHTPSRSVTVQVRPSPLVSAFSARAGCTELSSPMRNSASVTP